MSRRRQLVVTLGAALVGRAELAFGQTAVPPHKRVGIPAQGNWSSAQPVIKPFMDEMVPLGWIDGRNVAYDWSTADGQQALLPRRAAELVARQPDALLPATQPAALALRQVSTTIPIVFGSVNDPVQLGLVGSLAHPGGNMTGVSSSWSLLAAKRVQLLREIMPSVKRVGVLRDPRDPTQNGAMAALAQAVAALGVMIVPTDFIDATDIDVAISRQIDARVDAVHADSTSEPESFSGATEQRARTASGPGAKRSHSGLWRAFATTTGRLWA